jgi:hypothetical protein
LLCHFALLFLHFEGVVWRLGCRVWDLASGLELAGYFILGAEAPGTDIDFSFSSLYHNRSTLDIRQPAPEGMLFGVAYVMPELSFFTANFALHRNFPVC